MKLFLVIYAGIQIGGSAGPLPYGMEECEKRRDVFRSLQQEVIDTGFLKALNRAATPDEMQKTKEMRFECEWRVSRPELGDPA